MSIANEFASSFSVPLDTAPSGDGRVTSTLEALRKRLDSYIGASLDFDDVITIEIIDRIISKLGTGKAAGQMVSLQSISNSAILSFYLHCACYSQ